MQGQQDDVKSTSNMFIFQWGKEWNMVKRYMIYHQHYGTRIVYATYQLGAKWARVTRANLCCKGTSCSEIPLRLSVKSARLCCTCGGGRYAKSKSQNAQKQLQNWTSWNFDNLDSPTFVARRLVPPRIEWLKEPGWMVSDHLFAWEIWEKYCLLPRKLPSPLLIQLVADFTLAGLHLSFIKRLKVRCAIALLYQTDCPPTRIYGECLPRTTPRPALQRGPLMLTHGQTHKGLP